MLGHVPKETGLVQHHPTRGALMPGRTQLIGIDAQLHEADGTAVRHLCCAHFGVKEQDLRHLNKRKLAACLAEQLLYETDDDNDNGDDNGDDYNI